jgi:hypothetical protein
MQIMDGVSENFQFGDIILTRNNSLMGQVNAAYQRQRRNRSLTNTVKSYEFIPTHAALVLIGTEVIQSNKRSTQIKDAEITSLFNRQTLQFLSDMYKNGLHQALRQVEHRDVLNLTRLLLGHGVDIDTEFLQTLVPSDTLVIRHPMMASIDLATMQKMRQSAFYHLGKPYNTLIEASDGKGVTAFCSQLIYTIFNDVRIEMPSEEAHHVLPLDFLIWAVARNWQIITHDQVKSLQLQYLQNLDMYGRSDLRTVEWHDTVVERAQEAQNTFQTIAELEQIFANITLFTNSFQKIMGIVPSPRLYKASGEKLVPFSVEMITLAGDKFYRCLVGCEPPDVNTPSKTEDQAPVFPAFDALEAKKLSWLLETGASADKKKPAIDPELITSTHTIKLAEARLDDFDLALKEAIAHVNTQLGTSDSAPLQQSGKTSDNEPLEVLWSIAESLEHSKDKEDIEKRLSSVYESLTVTMKQVRDEMQELVMVSEAYAQDSEQLVQVPKVCMAGIVRWHAYACAYDFLMICNGLAMLDELLAGRNLTLSDLYEYVPQVLLDILTFMDTSQRMRHVTLTNINNLPPLKQFWDNM